MKTREIEMKFVKENFRMHGDHMMYDTDSLFNLRFVARFKHMRAESRRFQKFLIENFTVEEYFGHLDNNIPPLRILQMKGYMSTNEIRYCKMRGIPQTRESFLDSLIGQPSVLTA